jgi:putative hydrolase of the HAD superfamily
VPELPGIIEHLGLTPHLVHIFNSAETGYEKPHPHAFRLVLDAMPDLQDVWMVGDNIEADVKGALRVGIPAILVRKHHNDADYYAETLYDIPGILNSVAEG